MLVAGTIVGMLPGFPNGKMLLDAMQAPAAAFSQQLLLKRGKETKLREGRVPKTAGLVQSSGLFFK